jgi:CRISPR/Cas system-associated protein Cas10 (large subunit of type III CRISPR-Cas system)
MRMQSLNQSIAHYGKTAEQIAAEARQRRNHLKKVLAKENAIALSLRAIRYREIIRKLDSSIDPKQRKIREEVEEKLSIVYEYLARVDPVIRKRER